MICNFDVIEYRSTEIILPWSIGQGSKKAVLSF